jgi:uncharacterized protein (TIRG00374 family)
LKKTLITTLKIVLPIGIGVYLTWFFISKMSDVELDNLKNAFINADYRYIFLAILLSLLSHISRSYRWKYMLEPLGHQPKFWKMYHSVMIGYIINLTIPRSGEVARAGYYAKYQKGATFDKVFGTIIVERVIDMLMLGLVFGITVYLQKDLEAFNNITDTGKSESTMPTWAYFLIAGVAVIGIIVMIKSQKIKEKVISLFKGVLDGVKTIFQLKQRVAYIAHTFFIWICYLGMIWVCAFALPETSELTINAVFAAFFAGGIAMSTTPGGIGLYPLMVSAVLVNLYGIENAESFSMLAWTSLTAFTIIAGLISLVTLPFISKKSTLIE